LFSHAPIANAQIEYLLCEQVHKRKGREEGISGRNQG
jgi:hypothetical protein